jgi:hypothetical protein
VCGTGSGRRWNRGWMEKTKKPMKHYWTYSS